MEQHKIDRINELAKSIKPRGLPKKKWRNARVYALNTLPLSAKNLAAQLENTYVVDENGNKRKLQKKTAASRESLFILTKKGQNATMF